MFLQISTTLAVLCLSFFAAQTQPAAPADAPPAVGEQAADFTLATLDGTDVVLSEKLEESPVVLVVLRGWPGYQCPICTRQVADLMSSAKNFADSGAEVLLVYPGPAENLDAHAKEFIAGKTFPENFTFVLDPAYEFTNAWHLRWDEQGETAYPSSFVISKDGTIQYAKVSKSHGDRAPTNELVDAAAAQ